MEVFAGVGPSGRRRQTAEPSEERREGAAPAAAHGSPAPAQGGRESPRGRKKWLAGGGGMRSEVPMSDMGG